MPLAYSANHPNPTNTISLFCKIRSYVSQSSMMMHRWLMTMACIDRCMLSSVSVRLRGFANPRTAYRIVLVNVIIWIILPVHNLIFLDIRGGFCAFPLATAAIYHSIFTIITGCLLPILIMIICAVLIHYNLASKRERHRQRNIHSQAVDPTARLLKKRDHQVLVMLLAQVVVYSFSVIPWTSFIAFTTFTRDVTNKSTDRLAIEAFLRYLTEVIAYIYPTLSFYIYTLTSHTFRHQLIKTIRSILAYRNRCCVRSQRIRPALENT
jgi:hypothetical protein